MGEEGDEEIADWRLRIEEVIGHGSLVIGDPIVLLGFLQPFERPPPESTNDDSCGHIPADQSIGPTAVTCYSRCRKRDRE